MEQRSGTHQVGPAEEIAKVSRPRRPLRKGVGEAEGPHLIGRDRMTNANPSTPKLGSGRPTGCGSRPVAILFLLLLCVYPLAAQATVLFDFNALAAGKKSATGPDLIEQYLEGLYGSNITVNLGAETRRKKIEGRPSGLYLGNSDLALDPGPFGLPPGHLGPTDTFLINRWNARRIPQEVRDRIVITFEDVPIDSVEFDWEIFPVTASGQNADITVKADGATIFHEALFGKDKEKGDLGHFGPFFFATPVRTLEFIDWTDAPIGIDNLSVNQQVPEPSSLVLLLAATAALVLAPRVRAWAVRKSRKPTSRSQ